MRQPTKTERQYILNEDKRLNVISRIVFIVLLVIFISLTVFSIYLIFRGELLLILLLILFDPLLIIAMLLVLRNSKTVLFEFEKIYALTGVLIIQTGFRSVRYYINNFEVQFPYKLLSHIKNYKSGDMVNVEVLPAIYSDREIHYIVSLDDVSL